MSFNITPVASGYQEIHPYSAMNIDSVKINTSLIMMKECILSVGKSKSDSYGRAGNQFKGGEGADSSSSQKMWPKTSKPARAEMEMIIIAIS